MPRAVELLNLAAMSAQIRGAQAKPADGAGVIAAIEKRDAMLTPLASVAADRLFRALSERSTDLEFVRGPGVNAVYGLELRFGPSGPPSRSWGVDITGVEVNRGIWSAVPVTIAIPLPSALLLTGTGLAALGLSRTRRR